MCVGRRRRWRLRGHSEGKRKRAERSDRIGSDRFGTDRRHDTPTRRTTLTAKRNQSPTLGREGDKGSGGRDEIEGTAAGADGRQVKGFESADDPMHRRSRSAHAELVTSAAHATLPTVICCLSVPLLRPIFVCVCLPRCGPVVGERMSERIDWLGPVWTVHPAANPGQRPNNERQPMRCDVMRCVCRQRRVGKRERMEGEWRMNATDPLCHRWLLIDRLRCCTATRRRAAVAAAALLDALGWRRMAPLTQRHGRVRSTGVHASRMDHVCGRCADDCWLGWRCSVRCCAACSPRPSPPSVAIALTLSHSSLTPSIPLRCIRLHHRLHACPLRVCARW